MPCGYLVLFFIKKSTALAFQRRQGGGGHGLAHPAELLVGQRGDHLAVQLRVLVGQDLLAGVQDDVAALAGHDPAQQQHVLAAVELVVVGQGVAQVHADGRIDLGGGLKDPLKSTAKIDEVTDPSPLRTLLEGMLNPTVQANGPRPVNMRGFMSVMGNTMMSANTAERFGDHSYAIVSDKYLNFSSRVGYHYAILDCWCSATVSKNYIRFEFAGGAAGSVQRQRRVRCIGIILKELGFRVSVIADRVQARYQKYPRADIMQRLDQLGRLLIMTRQMDMLMTSEEAVTKFASNFLNGDYH